MITGYTYIKVIQHFSKEDLFTNERVFGINIISNLCSNHQCIIQWNHSFDVDEVEVGSFSITNIGQDSLAEF